MFSDYCFSWLKNELDCDLNLILVSEETTPKYYDDSHILATLYFHLKLSYKFFAPLPGTVA